MDTKLGKLDLTREQFERSRSLHSENIRSFSMRDGEVTVVSINNLTEQEKQDLVTALSALDTKPLPPSRLEELKAKQTLTLPEVTEVLKIHGLA